MINRRQFVVAGLATTVAAASVSETGAAGTTPRLRRDVTKLPTSDPIFAKYGEAVKRMHGLPVNDQRNWRNQALIHLNYCPHGVSDFFHWHRHYVANFESICAQLIGDPAFALPYWNWSANKGRIPDPFYDLQNLNVEFWHDPSNASSSNWGSVSTVGTRNLKKGQGLQDDPRRGGSFTDAAITSIQQESQFDIYWGGIEGSPHNNAHVISGGRTGHIGDGMSPLDPIFWLHHCNVDRLWAQWQAAGNTAPAVGNNYSGQFVDAAGKPVTNATSANALDISQFNYSYDTLSSPIIVTMSQKLALQPFDKQTVLRPDDVSRTRLTLGVEGTQKNVASLVETRFSVATKELLPNLFKSRTFWAPNVLGVQRLAAEPSRVVAHLMQVIAPEDRIPLIVNVFVNCPYLSPETDSNDQHYAGSFSFFGHPHGHAQGQDFFIDLTRPLRQLAADGRIANEQVNVQLMALPIDPETKANFSVGSVQLLAV